jgi:hypothetical protein
MDGAKRAFFNSVSSVVFGTVVRTTVNSLLDLQIQFITYASRRYRCLDAGVTISMLFLIKKPYGRGIDVVVIVLCQLAFENSSYRNLVVDRYSCILKHIHL